MRLRVFADTSALVAHYHPGDARHASVEAALAELVGLGAHFTTTTDVFDETITILKAKAGHVVATTAGLSIMNSRNWRLHPIGNATRREAWDLFRKFHDHNFSLTDCTSFITMQRFSIVDALTLDADFRIMGFTTRPT